MEKRRYQPPLMHSNLSTNENLRSRFDPNGSYTGTPDSSHPAPSDIDDLAPHTQLPYKDEATPSSNGSIKYADVSDKTGGVIKTPDGKPDLTYSDDAILPDCPMPEGWNDSYCTSFKPKDADGYPSVPDGELPINRADEPDVPVQDVDDL